MTDQKLDEAAGHAEEPPASTVAEKSFENEGGSLPSGSPAQGPTPARRRGLAGAVDRVKEKLTAGTGAMSGTK